MSKPPKDRTSDRELRHTVERLEENEEVDPSELENTYREYRDRSDSEDADEFLQYLLEENVIDEDTYVTAAEEQSVRVDEGEFDQLPAREEYFELHGLIDEGGMGKICVGHDPHLDRKVAVKVLRKEKSDSDLERRRFLREAQVTAKLAHPNIVPVHTLHSERSTQASFTMKLVDGQTLFDLVWDARDEVGRGNSLDDRLEFRRRIELFLRVCDAIAYAHNRGVIHRDLKPSNIMVGAYNEVYVMDWGIAKILDQRTEEQDVLWETQWEEIDQDDEVKTQAGSLVGTPPYMPPEQARGRHDELSARSDLYSLGAILFELVTLERMIEGDKVYDVLKNIQEGNRAPFEAYAPEEYVDSELEAIIRKATAEEAEQRYESVDELAEEVRRYLDDREVRAHPDGPLRKVTRWMTHHRDTAAVILFGIFVVAASAVMWSLWKQKRAVQQSRHREAQLSRLQTEISSLSHRIDNQFLRFELLVGRLSVAAGQRLAEPPTYEGPIYSSADFADAHTAPEDLRWAPLYEKEISLGNPVYKLAPGVEEDEAIEQTVRQLMPLRSQFRSIFLDSRLDSNQSVPSGEAFWRLLADEGVPGRWAFVGLESGIHFAYPGKGGYDADYDPRDRPWYRAGKTGGETSWGSPYPDAQGQGLVLPCVSRIESHEGTLIGVAGFEVTLDFIKNHFMKPIGPIESTYVLDGEGEILVTSNESALADPSDPATFHISSVLEMVREDRSGIFETSGSPPDVYAVFRMPTLDWFYVAKSPLPALLEWSQEGPERSVSPADR